MDEAVEYIENLVLETFGEIGDEVPSLEETYDHMELYKDIGEETENKYIYLLCVTKIAQCQEVLKKYHNVDLW